MKEISKTKTQYDSLMEFAILGKDDELLNTKTLIATKKKKLVKLKDKNGYTKEN